jgi:hypothetical protein
MHDLTDSSAGEKFGEPSPDCETHPGAQRKPSLDYLPEAVSFHDGTPEFRESAAQLALTSNRPIAQTAHGLG